jgi:peptide/nickel transport system ATP-binding protein
MAILYSFPVPGSLVSLAMALTAAIWPPLALRVREEVQRNQEEPFVEAARREGAGAWALIWQEIWPQMRPVLSTLAVLASIEAIALEATIGFLGGAAPGVASLGQLLVDARLALNRAGADHAFRYIGAATAGLSVLLIGLRLIQSWVDGLRVARTVVLEDVVAVIPEGLGWVVTVWHRATGILLVRDAWIPYRPGELTVVAGGSGSGKSLAMMAIADLLPPDLACRVNMVGGAGSRRRLQIQYVPQALQENFGAGTRVDQYLRAIGYPESQWASYLTSFGLNANGEGDNGLRDRRGRWKRVGNLSGGMAQRFALALSLLRKPDVLVLDEPLSALDEDLVTKIGPLLSRRLADHPEMALLVVNHRADFTRQHAATVAFLASGRTVWTGQARVLFNLDFDGPSTPLQVGRYLESMQVLEAGVENHPLDTASNGPASVVLDSVTIRHSNATSPVIAGCSMTAYPGESVVLDAPSGGGKSTVLYAMAGRVRPENGRILVYGFEPFQPEGPDWSLAWRRAVRLVHQSPSQSLSPWVQTRTILRRTIRRLRLEEQAGQAATELIEEACRRAGFPVEKLELCPATLSGGLRVRAGLARAFLGDPRVLLLDEPTAGLDPEVVVTVMDSIRNLVSERQVTVILAEHVALHADFLGARRVSLRTGPKSPTSATPADMVPAGCGSVSLCRSPFPVEISGKDFR